LSAVKPLPLINSAEAVVTAVRDAVTHVFPAGLRAVVLTGSLARGEGTWLFEHQATRLAGDAEFFAIFDDGVALPSAARVAALIEEVENLLRANSITAKIGVSPVGPDYLRRLRPHIFAYELLHHGQVICGDPRVLELATPFASAAIPLEDGFRLLLNRMIELIESVCAAPCDLDAALLPERVRHSAAKLWLDTATSYLLFQGQYESTYRARGAGLVRSLAAGLATPIDAAHFVERVTVATQWKLGDNIAMPTVTVDDLVTQVGDAQKLWRWELGRLDPASGASGDRELMRRWIAGQPLAARGRGWAAVVKRHGITPSLARLPRWAAQAMAGSPRYLIYGAASEFFFALPAILRPDSGAARPPSWAFVRRGLPVVNQAEEDGSWCHAGAAIAWNYHRFLEDTRA
jgi:hypothetical protein